MKITQSYIMGKNESSSINAERLTSLFNVPPKTVRNGLSKFVRGKSKNWGHFKVGKVTWVIRKLIPEQTVKNYNLGNSDEELIRNIKIREGHQHNNESSYLMNLKKEFSDFVEVEWPHYSSHYKEFSYGEIESFARTEASLEFIKNHAHHDVEWEILYSLYEPKKIEANENEDGRIELIYGFRRGYTVDYFKKKIWKGITLGFKSIIVNGNKGKTSSLKTPEDCKKYIIGLIVSPENYKLTTITEMVKKHPDFEDVSYRTVRRIRQEYKELARAGTKGIRDYAINSAPYLICKTPLHIGDYAEADGSRYQFVAADEKGSVVFQRDYVIIDGASNKITGYAIGDSENEDLALSAFRIHCKKYKFLSKEVVVDGASSHTSKLFERFKNRSKLLGVVWRPASSSTSLGMVERFHNTFQTRICNGKKFYIGEGIRSRNERSRPSKEVIALYRDKDNLITVRELRKEFFDHISEFNENKF